MFPTWCSPTVPLPMRTAACIFHYAASDTRLHVASTTIDKLLDFAFNTPADPLRSVDCVKQRCALIDKNLEYLKSIGE